MVKKLKSYYHNLAIRHHRLVVAFAVGLLVAFGCAAAYAVFPIREAEIKVLPTAPVSNDEETTAIVGPYLEEMSPVHISIPVAGIEADFEGPLGLNADQTIEVPDSYEEVGWYQYGPTPGELGPAVVLGHVDSYEGPAVFYSLGEVSQGDEILITRSDGSVATFEVTHAERHPQSDFPTREVYSDIDHAGLRVITCTGVYDHGIQRYSHNLIVFAKLVTATTSATSPGS